MRKLILGLLIVGWMLVAVFFLSCAQDKMKNPVKKETFVDRDGDEAAQKEIYLHKQDIDQIAGYLKKETKTNNEYLGIIVTIMLAIVTLQVAFDRSIVNKVSKLFSESAKQGQIDVDRVIMCDTKHAALDKVVADHEIRIRTLEHKH